MDFSELSPSLVNEYLPDMDPLLAAMFEKCFANTLLTTTQILDDGTTYVITGDIRAMWLRDSSAQVRHYLPFAKANGSIRRVIEGLTRRQMRYIQIDPYANAFNKNPEEKRENGDLTQDSPWIWERKYEVDSLCYPIELAYRYWKETGSTAALDESFQKACKTALDLWELEQNHQNSPYRFMRPQGPQSDTLTYEGKGSPVAYTGMSWSGFRPSDDATIYGYNIPGNMFLAVVLGHLAEMERQVFDCEALAVRAEQLLAQVDRGIRTYGVVEHPRYGKIYAYEADGLGRSNLMDDANVPSLLSIPYIGYRDASDAIYRNTRAFVLSKENPYYASGKYACGVGSPHTPQGYIWPIALVMQALTAGDEAEIAGLLAMLVSSDAGTGFMHESFHPDDPLQFTRSWFAWANSIFAELILSLHQKGFDLKHIGRRNCR